MIIWKFQNYLVPLHANILGVMDVAFILDKYFKGMKDVSIDVFDAQTLNAVYRDVINELLITEPMQQNSTMRNL